MASADILIIGGGLTGLTAACHLDKDGYTVFIIEARNRLGGRIHTLRNEDEPPIEMGATWLGKKHHHLLDLLDELDIGIFEQFMGNTAYYEPISTSPPQLVQLPPNEEPSYRIEGGSDNLIRTLAEKLDPSSIKLGQRVKEIHKKSKNVEVKTQRDTFKADIVISTLPPKLLVESISITPALPGPLSDIAAKTHTWMGESIKIALTYRAPFWRASNTSGTVFSNVGPLTELYDHSDDEASRYALKGFMNDSYHGVSREERIDLVMQQLQRIYGEAAVNYQSYREQVWRKEAFTYADYNGYIIPHQNNGNPAFSDTFWDGQLLLSGSETAEAYPGYMDGAVESARRVYKQVKI